jgi:lipoprotein-anchoring transpeptidase ErfK/SrfK
MLPRLVVVDRHHRRLDVWRFKRLRNRYERTHHFDVTVGKAGSETAHGLYFVGNKSRTPDWRIPSDPDYNPDTWGTVVPFGAPGNPFAGGFISLAGKHTGIGIHGTSFDPRVGTASSHGCIRMRVNDLLTIYDQLKPGTPVYLD